MVIFFVISSFTTKFASTIAMLLSRSRRFLQQKRFASSFEDAVSNLKKLNNKPDNETLLKLYSLYKQATDGPSNFSFSLNPIEHAKGRAWSALGNMSKDDAKNQYIQLAEKLIGVATKEERVVTSQSGTVESYSVEHVAFPRRQSNRNQTATEFIQLDDVDPFGVSKMWLNRSSTLNAFNMKMWHELGIAFRNLSNKSRVVILSSTNPKAFSTGMDLNVFQEMQETMLKERCEGRRREALGHLIAFLQAQISSPEKCPVPVIAAISGHCIGGALDLVTACDIRYCTADTNFSIKETDLAMVADIGTLQRLPKLIGDQRCREVAYTGRVVSGKEAESIGLVARCFDSYEAMQEHVYETAKQIASKSPLTIRGIKKTLLFSRDHSVEESLQQVSALNQAQLYSDDLVQAMVAAMTKTAPTFKGE